MLKIQFKQVLRFLNDLDEKDAGVKSTPASYKNMPLKLHKKEKSSETDNCSIANFYIIV